MTLDYATVNDFEGKEGLFASVILAELNQTGAAVENIRTRAGSVVVTYDLVFPTTSGLVINEDGAAVEPESLVLAKAPTLDFAVAAAFNVSVVSGTNITFQYSQYLPPSPPPSPPSAPPSPPPAGPAPPPPNSPSPPSATEGVVGAALPGLPIGAIVGGTVGGFVGCVLLICLAVLFDRSRRRKRSAAIHTAADGSASEPGGAGAAPVRISPPSTAASGTVAPVSRADGSSAA